MASWKAWQLNAFLRFQMKRHGDSGLDLTRSRRTTREPLPNMLRVPDDMRVDEVTTEHRLQFDVADRAAARAKPPEAIVYYLHGGGYFFGSPKTHRQIIVALAKTFDAPVYALDYRLAPEHPFPAAAEDAAAGYRYLQTQYPNAKIVIAGDSAGGGLALSTVLGAREAGLTLPVAIIGYSPWTDLALTGDSIATNAGRCAMFTPKGVAEATRLYVGKADPKHPRISPLYADLAGLPPMLLFASRDETLYSDSTRLAAKARAAGVQVELHEADGVPHVWPIFVRVIPEAQLALQQVAAFRDRVLGPSKASVAA